MHPLCLSMIRRIKLISPTHYIPIRVGESPINFPPGPFRWIKSIQRINPIQQILLRDGLDITVPLRLTFSRQHHLHLTSLCTSECFPVWENPTSTTLVFIVPFIRVPVCVGGTILAMVHFFPFDTLLPLCAG